MGKHKIHVYHWMCRPVTEQEIPGIYSQGTMPNPIRPMQWVDTNDIGSFLINLTEKFDVMMIGEKSDEDGKYQCIFIDDKGKRFKQR